MGPPDPASDEAALADDKMADAPAKSAMLASYFQGSGMTLQEYFKFPEMKQIRNPVHEYFRSGKVADGAGTWLEEGTLAIEESEEGWMVLGAEHLELARIAVRGSGNRHYQARAFHGSYV